MGIPDESALFLSPDDPLVRSLAEPGERFLPPLDVIDWWEHPDSHARISPTGLAGVERQLIITTNRIIVMNEGSIERRIPIRAIGGAEKRDPPDGANQDSEQAVLVKSGIKKDTALGMWSLPSEQADKLMGDIFNLAHGIPLT
jgi:hypothetical protein